MSYTDYGLTEGLTMLIWPIILIFIVYVINMFGAKENKPYQRLYSLLFIAIMLMLTLDTLWWALDIQTGIIDYLYDTPSGTEQVTLFSFILYGLLIYMVLSKPKKNPTDTSDDKD